MERYCGDNDLGCVGYYKDKDDAIEMMYSTLEDELVDAWIIEEDEELTRDDLIWHVGKTYTICNTYDEEIEYWHNITCYSRIWVETNTLN